MLLLENHLLEKMEENKRLFEKRKLQIMPIFPYITHSQNVSYIDHNPSVVMQNF